jgi:hypothetical protein
LLIVGSALLLQRLYCYIVFWFDYQQRQRLQRRPPLPQRQCPPLPQRQWPPLPQRQCCTCVTAFMSAVAPSIAAPFMGAAGAPVIATRPMAALAKAVSMILRIACFLLRFSTKRSRI